MRREESILILSFIAPVSGIPTTMNCEDQVDIIRDAVSRRHEAYLEIKGSGYTKIKDTIRP